MSGWSVDPSSPGPSMSASVPTWTLDADLPDCREGNEMSLGSAGLFPKLSVSLVLLQGVPQGEGIRSTIYQDVSQPL